MGDAQVIKLKLIIKRPNPPQTWTFKSTHLKEAETHHIKLNISAHTRTHKNPESINQRGIRK